MSGRSAAQRQPTRELPMDEAAFARELEEMKAGRMP